MIQAVSHKYAIEYPEYSIDLKSRIINGQRIFREVANQPVPLSQAKLSLKEISSTHDYQYLTQLRRMSSRNIHAFLDPELKTNHLSWPAASRAAAMVSEQALESLSDKRVSLCFSRPGSHHAGLDYGLGLCLINNLAVAANQVLQEISKVAIIDFDAHHGNGTEQLFYENDNVFTSSIHQYPFFPGTGGEQYNNRSNLNIPLAAESTDSDFQALQQMIDSAVSFQPQIVFVEAGVDGHYLDKFSDLHFSDEWFNQCGKQLQQINKAGIPVVIEMGGGYTYNAINQGFKAFLEGLINE
jgi:acetoin utilization deacetylase AcuC-like enzyme